MSEVQQKGSLETLKNMIYARLPYVHVVTHDEADFVQQLASILKLHPVEAVDGKKEKDKTDESVDTRASRQLFTWSAYQGIIEYDENVAATQYQESVERASGDFDKTWNPQTALEKICAHKPPENWGSIFVMRDMNTALVQPIVRQLRDMYQHLIDTNKTIIILSSQLSHGPGGNTKGIEPTLEKQISILHWSRPTQAEIITKIKTVLSTSNFPAEYKVTYSDPEILSFARSLQGLTNIEIDNSMAICFIEMQRLDPVRLLEEKKQVIMRSDILEYIESTETMDEVGGLDNLKNYINAHANNNSSDAEEFGVEPLKGLLLLGIPGSGKSLSAKALGTKWKIPTLRLDVGKVMAGLVGASEQRMREVIDTVRSVAPAILWIDEVEKALSGTKSSNHSDGGTLSRVFGTLLTAMEEKMQGVTVVATANDISVLPPELIRRFSEVFFVGTPVKEERDEIFQIHLKKKKRDPKNFDLKLLVDKSDKFTGAEIQKAIAEAVSTAYNDGKRQVTTDDIIKAIQATKPIAVLMKEKIDETIDWARHRARFASSLAQAELAPGKQSLTLASGKKVNVGDSLSEDDSDTPVVKTTKKNTRLSVTK